MGRTIIAASGLIVLWLLMSGIYDKSLILIFGAISVVLAVWVGKRMDVADGEQLPFPVNPIAIFKYLLWLLVEIAKSNWAVTKVILSPKQRLRQNLFNVPVTQQSEIAQVVYANSITLTPGTITVETEDRHFLVHALSYDDSDMDALADMDQRVTRLES